MKTIQKATFPAFIAIAAIALSGCADTSESTEADSSTSPETLVAAADPSLLPYNFLGEDNQTWEGINIDLAAALSEELGATIEFETASFDAIIPGLQSGRYDLALTGMFDTLERQETVDFVDYLGAKNDFITPQDLDVAPETMDDLCGLRVGIPGGALEADLLAEASETCVTNGDEAITVNEYADLDAVVLSLTSGRIDVAPNDSATNAYILSQNPDSLRTSGGYLTDGYFAAAFPKGSELVGEFEQAFTAIMDNGTYLEILEEWGIADRALDAPIINGATF